MDETGQTIIKGKNTVLVGKTQTQIWLKNQMKKEIEKHSIEKSIKEKEYINVIIKK